MGMSLIVACGGGTTADTTPPDTAVTTTTTAPATTTTTAPATTTTTVPATTTTTIPAVDSAVVAEAFRAYFDRIAAQDYDGARELSGGAAADYASFTEHLNLISPQPDWQFDSETGWGVGDAIALGDGRHGVEGTLLYTSSDGSRLEVSNPVVHVSVGITTLDEWGVDLGSGVDQAPLSQRLQRFERMGNLSGCNSAGMWAYVPGGVPIDVQIPIILIGLECSVSFDTHSLDTVPQVSKSGIYSEDETVGIYLDNAPLLASPTVFLLQGGGDIVEGDTPTLYLAVFELPREALAARLVWETPFVEKDRPFITSFHAWRFGPFDLR